MSKLLNAKILIGLWLATLLAPAGYGACTYTVSPPMQSRGYGAATNTFTVNAGPGCVWSVSNSVSWISILSGASGTSTGTVTYAVAANPYFVGRTGVVTVAGATFTVEQDAAACNYSISPTLREHGNGAVTNTFSVIVGTGCVWSVSNPVSWITIQSGANGTGTSNVTYKISANIDSIGRTGIVTVAGISFTVRQDGAPCNFSITPDGRNHGNGGVGQANPIDITATTNCAWTVINTNPWINFIGATSGVGNGSVVYGVLANNVPVRRTGNVLIAEQLFELTQNAAGCQYEISPASRSHGHTGSTGTNRVDTIPANGGCAWVVVNTNDWITLIGNPAGTNTGKTFVYSVAPNPNSWPRDGALTVWGEPFFVYQQPAPCSNGYSIFPSSSEPGPEPETNTVQVTAIGGCPWAVVNTNSWISILSPTSATNSGIVTWKVSLNPNSVGRTGVVMIAEKAFTVRQDGALCTYKLSPTNRTHGYSAATNSVSLDTLSICSWSVVNTNPWITILSTNGIGDSNITYSVSPNGGLTDRTGVVVIGGQPFTLTQSGLGCAVNLSTTARNHGHGTGTNTIIVNIASTCAWTVSNSNSWITILTNSSGVGTNTVTYMVGANPTILPRTNYLNIEEGVIMISQNGAPCSPSISPSSFSHDAGQESRTVNVTAPIGCNWTVVNTNPWISILSGTSGTGSAGVLYQISANLGSTWRTGIVTIADEIYTVKQDSMTCNYKLSPTNRAHGYGTTTGFLTMNASNLCPWSVVTPNSWITILSGPNGVGSNVVNYSLENNNLTPFERIGSIVVGGISCVITQSGMPCTYAVTPDTRTHGFGAASNFFTVNATNGCTWSVGNTNPWISLVVANGNGSVPVGYSVTENASTSNRIGVLTLDGGQTFTVTQLASSCSISLSPTNRSHGYAATTNGVFVDTAFGCGWPVVSLTPWITILTGSTGSGTGTVTYAVASNLTFSARSGSIQIGSEIYVVNQGAFNCNYKLSPATRTHGFGVNSNSATITAGSVCEWTASTTDSWITITSASSGIGNGSFNYMVSPNFGTTSRTGTVTMAEETLVITQLAATNGFAFESVLPGPSGEVVLKLNGGPPGIWGIYSSPDLITWTKFANITNTTGRVEFIVPSTGGTNCFYRAALQ